MLGPQNPVDLSGTYPLPASQLDRFLFRLSLGHLTADVESKLIQSRRGEVPAPLKPIATAAELIELQRAADSIRVDPAVADYVVAIATGTRQHNEIERGVSTRAGLALLSAARAQALWEGRDFLPPADVRTVLLPCWSHRLMLKSAVGGAFSRDEAAHLLDELARKVPVPR